MNKRYTKCIVPTRQSTYLKDNFSIIILAARPNNRMKSYGSPSLFKIGTDPLIVKQSAVIDQLNANIDVILVTGFEVDRVVRKTPSHIRIIENVQYDGTNECEDIRLGLQACITKSVLIVSGNTLFNMAALDQIKTTQSTLVADDKQQVSDNLGITVVDGKPTILSYGISEPQWCNIGYFTSKDLKLLTNYCRNREHNRHFMFESINYILSNSNTMHILIPQYLQVSLLGCSKGLKQENENIISQR